MRGVALGVFVVAVGAALFAWLSGRDSSFAGFSGEQLRTLELAYQLAQTQRPVEPLTPPSRKAARLLDRARDTAEQAAISLSMLEDERRRRVLFNGALATAALSALGLVALLRRGRRASSAEEGRLMVALGTPESVLAAEQARAAKLLGVPLDASRQMVEEALSAQLAARHPSRLVGLAPQLQQAAEEQRQALIRARDCLLGVAERPLSPGHGSAAHRAGPHLPT
jgi:DnaJ-domain-containing protein 1